MYVCMHVCTCIHKYVRTLVRAYVCSMHACNVPVRIVSMLACISLDIPTSS